MYPVVFVFIVIIVAIIKITIIVCDGELRGIYIPLIYDYNMQFCGTSLDKDKNLWAVDSAWVI